MADNELKRLLSKLDRSVDCRSIAGHRANYYLRQPHVVKVVWFPRTDEFMMHLLVLRDDSVEVPDPVMARRRSGPYEIVVATAGVSFWGDSAQVQSCLGWDLSGYEEFDRGRGWVPFTDPTGR